jgi:carbon monoxide dehydrogenase subunit G
MASIRREIAVLAAADQLWAALRDVGAVADLFPGVLLASRADGDGRVVTFADGRQLRERIVAIDASQRRLVYSAEGFPHHNASMQILPETDESSRFIWVSDFLPDALGADIEPLIDAGVAAFAKRWSG